MTKTSPPQPDQADQYERQIANQRETHSLDKQHDAVTMRHLNMPATQTKIDDFCWTVKTVHTSDGGKSRAAAVESSHKRPSPFHDSSKADTHEEQRQPVRPETTMTANNGSGGSAAVADHPLSRDTQVNNETPVPPKKRRIRIAETSSEDETKDTQQPTPSTTNVIATRITAATTAADNEPPSISHGQDGNVAPLNTVPASGAHMTTNGGRVVPRTIHTETITVTCVHM